ncbi:MAG TPA: HPP family protein [Sphingobium sp.]
MPDDVQERVRPARSDAVLLYVRDHAMPSLISGLGGMLVIWLLSQLTITFDHVLLIAPFGSSCVLLFALPSSPLAQPTNVIGGHLISTFIGIAVLKVVGHNALACGLGVGLAIAAMQFTRLMHPPAGADPLVAILTGAGWSFLALPMLAGTIILVLLTLLYHRLISRRPYPAQFRAL